MGVDLKAELGREVEKGEDGCVGVWFGGCNVLRGKEDGPGTVDIGHGCR